MDRSSICGLDYLTHIESISLIVQVLVPCDFTQHLVPQVEIKLLVKGHQSS